LDIPRSARPLIEELRLLNGGGVARPRRPVVISSNFPVARDGFPVEGSRRPLDQGIAIYFDLGGEQKVMARDQYTRAEENMRALALSIEAMRSLERHGGGDMMSRAFTGFTALAAPNAERPWWEVMKVRRDASLDEIRAAYRREAKNVHPDAFGSSDAMAALSAARDKALKDRRTP
jgi:DnaJ domain